MKYRTAKDKNTGQWLVERIEPFFDLPTVIGMFSTQKQAYALAGKLKGNASILVSCHPESTYGI